MVGAASLVQSRLVRSRVVMTPAGVATAGRRVAGGGGGPHRSDAPRRSGSHGPAAPIAFSGPGGPPYGARGQDSLCQPRATRSDFPDRNSLLAGRHQTSPASKPPLTAGSMSTYA